MLFFSACTLDDEVLSDEAVFSANSRTNSAPQIANSQANDNNVTTVGRQLGNPFALSVMNTAYNIYYDTVVTLNPTHVYVKFLPSSLDHLNELENWESSTMNPLFDFPLNYEILSQGDSYIDPAVTDSLYTYQYGSIPISETLPNVPYVILEQLYLPEGLSKELEFIAFGIVGEQGDEYFGEGGDGPGPDGVVCDCAEDKDRDGYCDGIADDLGICWDPDDNDPCKPQWNPRWCTDEDEDNEDGGNNNNVNACGCPIGDYNRPAGCIQVESNLAATGWEQVRIAQVKLRRNLRTDMVYSDENGCWEAGKTFRKKVKVWVKFRNPNIKVRTTRYWLSTKSIEDYVDLFKRPYNNILVQYSYGAGHTSKARRYWASAHALNNIFDYREEAANDGVANPRGDLIYWVQPNELPSSAPMLQGNAFASWANYVALFILPAPIYFLYVPFHPDVINNYGSSELSDVYRSIGIHELAHASHYESVGEGYWRPYRSHIINNVGDGENGNFSGLGSNPGHVALGEAWAEYIQNRYSGIRGGGEGNPWRSNYIPQGFMFDLQDDGQDDIPAPDDPFIILGVDNINGFDAGQFYDALGTDETSIRDFRDRLWNMTGGAGNNQADYNNFVDLYDVFN